MSSIIRSMNQSFIRYPFQEIFRAPSHVAILRVLNQLNQGISGRELARRARINDRTCRLSLKRLEYLGVTEYLGTGKTKLIRLNRKNYFAKSIMPEIFKGEQNFFKSALVSIKELVPEDCEWACIYGSVAKKSDTMLSDVDLLLLVSNEAKIDDMQDMITDMITDHFEIYGLSISPLILTIDQWAEDIQFRDLKTNIINYHINLSGEQPLSFGSLIKLSQSRDP